MNVIKNIAGNDVVDAQFGDAGKVPLQAAGIMKTKEEQTICIDKT